MFWEAVGTVLAWPGIAYLVVGVAMGLLFGALPGLGGAAALAMLIPVSFGMNPFFAITLMMGAIGAVAQGGSIPAILVNTPGTAPNAATTLDGYPLARQGKAGMALGASATASSMGALFGLAVLLALLPVLSRVVLAFSYPEYFLMTAVGLSIIAWVSEGSMFKGLMSGLAGLMVATIGMDPMGARPRFDFHIDYLYDGISVVPVVIGMFAVSEAIALFRQGNQSVAVEGTAATVTRVWDGVRAVFQHFGLFVRSALVGTVVGIVPGAGGAVANFLAYLQAVHTCKKDARFGQGDIRGVIAPEAANDAKDGGSLVPTLAFGIPGSAEMAVLLGALMLHGIEPGPRMLMDHLDITYVLIWALALSNILASLFMIVMARQLSLLTLVPSRIIAPVIVVFSMVGGLAIHNTFGDVVVLLLFGIIGYGMRQYRFSRVAFVLGLVLARIAERSLHLTIQTVGLGSILTRPISIVLVLILLYTISHPVIQVVRKQIAQREGNVNAGAD